MVSFILLLFTLQSKSIPANYILLDDIIESQIIKLVQRPKLGKDITAVFEVLPKISKENLQVIFYGFESAKPISSDTFFKFNALKGKVRQFKVTLKYLSTPATFRVRISNGNIWWKPGLVLTRYLVNAESGEYGTIKEIQFNPPIEYRFNLNLKKFDQEVITIENGRWQKSRAIIDTMKNLIPEISDSLCLLLYADIFRVIYPPEITNSIEKARYLLEQGWQKYINEVDREEFLYRLKTENEIRNEKTRKKLEQETRAIQKSKFSRWLLSWLIPAVLLVFVLVLLLIIRTKIKSKIVTSRGLDRVMTYAIYLLVIGTAVYFIHLGVETLTPRRISKIHSNQDRKVLYEIKHTNLLKDFSDFKLSYTSFFGTSSGLGVNFTYEDKKHSKLNVEYYFTVQVQPTAEGYQMRQPVYSPVQAIEKFEDNIRVTSFLRKNKIKKATLKFADSLFSVAVDETLARNDLKVPVLLEYDGKLDIITTCTLPPDFEDENFPEIKMLSKLCRRWGYRIRDDTYIKRISRGSEKNPHLVALIEGAGNDTLHIWFSGENNFNYWWSPAPKILQTPQSIINQIYKEFSKAGLPSKYARDNVKIVSSRAIRSPEYFSYDEKDRVIVEAIFKWTTGYDWVDEMNNGEGAEFSVIYEYFADSLELGRALGKPGTRAIQRGWVEITPRYYRLRPIKQLISKQKAWRKLFNALINEEKFSKIYIKFNIPEAPNDPNHFILLAGAYGPHEIWVDLETAEVFNPLRSQDWH